jgi:hypothetical protein
MMQITLSLFCEMEYLFHKARSAILTALRSF